MSALNSTPAAPLAPQPIKNRFNEMSSEEFMKIIFTELQQQDPFSPNDSSARLEQLNSIRSIESDISMGKQLESIVFQNQLAGAGNLIGKRISGLTVDNERVAGQVKSVTRAGDEISLLLHNNWVVPMENVEYIDADPLQP
jgi:flagellar hook assembly protein FlgD